MIRYLPAHVATWVLIVFTSGVYSQEKTGKCNVKIWYLDLVTEGALSGNLSDEQLLLKGKIEKMVDKYKKLGRADGMVDCSILQMYEELLGEAPTDGRDTADSNGENSNNDEKDASDGKGKVKESEDFSSKGEQENADVKDDGEQKESENVNDDKQKETEDVKGDEKEESEDAKDGKQKESDDEDSERAESNDNDKGSKGAEKEGDKGTDKQEGNGSEEGGDNSEDEFADDTDLDDTDFGGDDEDGEADMDGSQAEAESLNTEEEESSEGKDSSAKGSHEQDSESSENKDSDSSDKSSESSNENDSNSLDKEKSGSSMEKDSYSSQIKDSEPPAKDSSDGKESSEKEDGRSSTDTDNKDSESITKDSEDSGENKKSSTDETQVRKRKTKLVEETVFDAKRGYVKVVKEVEVEDDEDEEKEEKEGKDTNEMVKETKQEKLENENEMVIKEENKSDENTEDKTNEEQNKKENEEEKKKNEEEKESERKEKEDKEKRKEKEMEHTKKEEEKRAEKKANKEEEEEEDDEEEDEEDDEEEKNDNTKPWQKTKERKLWEKAKNKEESSENSCSGDACKEQNNSQEEDSMYKYTAPAKHHKESEDEEPTCRKSQQQNNKADDREKETKRVDSRDFTADLHRFEMLFQQRASEYASKIQNLEIMIIRLENQLLGERLNKQNSSSSFSKLENQILRLENELLKLNQSYVDLKEENVMLKYRQRKYLELGSDKSKDQSSMGNSTKHFELINKQQNKISELSALLMNHSALFDKLQSKSHALEEQNQALYQIVMNQTALISNIMKKMQELSEENMKHRKETLDLKTQMDIKTNSDRLLEKLNTLVSVQIPGADVNEHKAKEKKSGGEILRIQSFFPKSPDADVIPWKCNGNNASRFCVFYSFILSPCPPFSTVYWHKCPYYYKDISQEHELHQESSQTSEPTTTNPEVPPAESKNVYTVPPATNIDNLAHVNDGVSKEALPTISSEDGRVLEEILKPEKDSQHEETRTKEDASEEQSEKVEEHVENQASKSEEKSQKPDKDPEDKGRLPSVEKVKVAPPKPAEPKHEDRKILYTTDKKLPKPRDCYEYNENGYERNGMYKIYVVGQEKHLPVYCDMDGGWTVIMKRSSGALDFYRDWNEYKKGFGGFYSEHWIGNDNLHYLTNQKHYSLKVVLEDFEFNSTFAMYDHFWVDDEDEGYRLHISGYSGTAGDGFAKHDKMRFSTKDADNDLITKELGEYDNSCAKRFTGAWWYYKCYMSNLTGQYYKNGKVPNKKFNGVSWKPWKKPHISLKSAIMMIRPFNAE